MTETDQLTTHHTPSQERSLERRMKQLERFVANEPNSLPVNLLDGLTRRQYKAMSHAERRAHLTITARTQLLAARSSRVAQASATTSVRYWVPCAGCGIWLPARSARPIVAYCSPAQLSTGRRRRTRCGATAG